MPPSTIRRTPSTWAPPSCVESPAGTLTCSLADLVSGTSEQIILTVDSSGACSGGAPIELQNLAAVSNVSAMAGPDPDPSNNSVVHSFAVQDTTPPVLTVEVSPTTLWPPNHKLVQVTVSLTATDACDDSPTIRLVSAVSNEADNGLGDGDTSSDIQGAELGTADTSLSLRAERSGPGNGRVYTLTYEAEDGSGNVTSVSTTVTVAKSRR